MPLSLVLVVFCDDELNFSSRDRSLLFSFSCVQGPLDEHGRPLAEADESSELSELPLIPNPSVSSIIPPNVSAFTQPPSSFVAPPAPSSSTSSQVPKQSQISAPKNTPPVERRAPVAAVPSVPEASSASHANDVSMDGIEKASKHCKYAQSALQYMDVKTAVENLQAALKILTAK